MNISVFYFLYSFAGQSTIIDNLIIFCGQYLPYLIILMAGTSVFFVNEGKKIHFRHIVFALMSASLAWGLAHLVKEISPTLRPYAVDSNLVHALFLPSDTSSFPSGHATFFFGLATAFFLLKHHRLGFLFGAGAFVIGLARVMSGIHYPFDILAGLATGVVVSILVHFFWLPSFEKTTCG